MKIKLILARCEIETLINLVENAKTTDEYDNDFLSEIIDDLSSQNNKFANEVELLSCIVDTLVDLVEEGICKAVNENDWDEYDNLKEINESIIWGKEKAEAEWEPGMTS